MKGNVFQPHGENNNKQQFLRTVGVLEEYVNKTFTYSQDVASICKSFKLTVLVQPTNKPDHQRIPEQHGEEDDMGDTYEDIHGKTRPDGGQHSSHLRNCVGAV